MIAPLILAAAATVPNQFLADFAGSWTCAGAKSSTTWTIEPTNGSWAVSKFGDPKAPGGVAYVGFIPSENRYVYQDFHSDGTYSALTSPAPTKHVYVWAGDYYPLDGKKDPGVLVTWTLTAQGTIERHFMHKTEKGIDDFGRDTCKRT